MFHKTLLGLLAALVLASCMSQEDRLAAQNAKDDQQCLSYGAKSGSDAYVACRTQLASARTNAEAMRHAAVIASPDR